MQKPSTCWNSPHAPAKNCCEHIEPASVRYRYDNPVLFGVKLLDAEKRRELSHALSQNIRVSPLVLPKVYATVVAAGELVAPNRQITVFVHASPDINATCLIDQDDHVLVFVSSELIKLLEEPELRFVIGHELGHVVYQHFRWQLPSDRDRNLRELELARAGEIAADRVGLLAARNVDAAASAMLKTASGLPSKHLEIDVAAYLRQARDLHRMDGDPTLAWSTHPSMLLRIRAALRFQTVLASMESGHDALAELETVDDDIFRS